MKKNTKFNDSKIQESKECLAGAVSFFKLFPELKDDRLSSTEFMQQVNLLGYLHKITELSKNFTVHFRRGRADYADFPKKKASILDTVNVVKNYLDSQSGNAADNKTKAVDLVRNMYGRNAKILDIFYYFFIDFLKLDNKITDESIKEPLKKAMTEASSFFFEKDISAAIGYLMVVLKLNKPVDPLSSLPISYESVKRNILEIIRNIDSKDGNNIYFYQYLLYEIAIIESDVQEKANFFNEVIDLLCEEEDGLLYANCSKEARLANHPHKLSVSVFFEILRELIDKNEGEALFYYFDKVRDLLYYPFREQEFDTMSFDSCHESYDCFFQEAEKIIQYFNIDEINDLESCVFLRMLLFNLTDTMSLICDLTEDLYICARNKELSRMKLTEFQQEQLEKIRGFIATSSLDNNIVNNLRVNLEHMLGPDHYDLVHISKKTDNIKNKSNSLLNNIYQRFQGINDKYYSFVHSYIEGIISKTMDPSEVLLKSDDCSIVVFRLSKKNVHRLFKIYDTAFQMKNGNVQLNLGTHQLSLKAINYIIEQVMIACNAKKNRDLANQARPLFGEMDRCVEEKSPIHEVSRDEKKLEPEDAIETQFYNALLFNEPMEADAPAKTKIKRSNRIQAVDDKKNSNLSVYNKDNKQDKKERNLLALNEARDFLLPKNTTEKQPKCPYILNIVHSKTERKNPIIIALNKELKFSGTTHNITRRDQKRINQFVQDIGLVREKGQDGIKYCDHVYVLKLRNVEGNSYRAIATDQKLESGAVMLVIDSVTNKTHADKAIRQAINAKKKRKRRKN